MPPLRIEPVGISWRGALFNNLWLVQCWAATVLKLIPLAVLLYLYPVYVALFLLAIEFCAAYAAIMHSVSFVPGICWDGKTGAYKIGQILRLTLVYVAPLYFEDNSLMSL